VPRRLPGSTIEQSRIIPAPPQEVYRALARAKEHAAFTGAPARGDARVGGTFTAWDGYITGRTLRCAPGKLLVQEWSTTEWPDATPPSRLEWRFAPHPRGTRVTLLQTGVPRSQARRYRTGWIEFYWRPLRAHFLRRT
jgi:uncharacterized protein YndB with AHSA1/START domain